MFTFAPLSVVYGGGPVQFGFEDGTEGWHPTDYEGAQAAREITTTTTVRYEGRHSLRIDLDLRAGHEVFGNGEAFVDVFKEDSDGERIPIDLEGNEIVMHVWCPPGVVGDSTSPNGFQVFVKDEKWRSEYSAWVNAVPGEWLRLSLVPTREEPDGGYKANVFNPRAIYIVGLKIGTGGDSEAVYQGPIYLDAVTYSGND